MSSPDNDLARRCQQGDVSACAELVRRYRRAVYGAARAVLGCREDAEDVAQDAFIRAFRAIDTFDQRGHFAGWMRRIAVNCALSRLRQRARREGQAGTVSDCPGSAEDPVDRLVVAEQDGRLRRAVSELPLKQRLAVTLFYLEDLNVAETAEAIGSSQQAVRVHLHRARRRLAQRLAQDLEEG